MYNIYQLSYLYRQAALTKAAGFLFVCHEDHTMFLVKRAPHVSEPNTWATVGGGVEKDEEFLEAAKREVQEELGSMPNITKIYGYKDAPLPNFVYRTFVAEVSLEEKNSWQPEMNPENTDYGWFMPDDLPEPLLSNFEKVLKKLYILD